MTGKEIKQSRIKPEDYRTRRRLILCTESALCKHWQGAGFELQIIYL